MFPFKGLFYVFAFVIYEDNFVLPILWGIN